MNRCLETSNKLPVSADTVCHRFSLQNDSSLLCELQQMFHFSRNYNKWCNKGADLLWRFIMQQDGILLIETTRLFLEKFNMWF